MTVWIDSDSCPSDVRNRVGEILHQFRDKGKDIRGVYVANRFLAVPEFEGLTLEIVSREKESADDFICNSLKEGDFVLTKDFLLAQKTVERKIGTMNFEGRLFEKEWLEKRIEERNFMEILYNSGSLSRYRKKSPSGEKIRSFALSFFTEIDKILPKGE